MKNQRRFDVLSPIFRASRSIEMQPIGEMAGQPTGHDGEFITKATASAERAAANGASSSAMAKTIWPCTGFSNPARFSFNVSGE